MNDNLIIFTYYIDDNEIPLFLIELKNDNFRVKITMVISFSEVRTQWFFSMFRNNFVGQIAKINFNPILLLLVS
jgi:hypothetical protein